MKKLFTFFFILLLSTIAILYTGCNSSSSDNGTATLKGRITDSVSGRGIDAQVTLTSTNFSKSVRADTLGNYIFLNLEGGTYGMSTLYPRYFTKVVNGIVVPSDDSLTVNVMIAATNVVTYYDNSLNEYFSPASYSSYILSSGTVCMASNTLKDVQLFDTIGIAGDTSVIIKSSDLDTVNPGYITRFSPSLGTLTAAQFDNLTTYADLIDPNNPDPAFPYNSTDVIPFPNAPNTVYAVYLRGKYTGANPRIFGLMYLDAVGFSNGRFVHIKLKLNVAGQNFFGINKK